MNVTKKKGAVLVKALGKPKAMKKRLGLKAVLKNNWQLYLLVLPAVIYFVVFNYLPLYGIQIAFKDYKAVDGIAGSAWAVSYTHLDVYKRQDYATVISG